MPINKKYRNKSPQKGEAGFTLMEMIIVIVLASILGIFVFGVLTKCLKAQRDMQVRKEMSDSAIRTLDKVNREFRECTVVMTSVDDTLVFEKSNSSASSDTNPIVAYIRNTGTNVLTRQSRPLFGGWDNINVIARNVSRFGITYGAAGPGTASRFTIQMEFESETGENDGSEWVTYLMPRD